MEDSTDIVVKAWMKFCKKNNAKYIGWSHGYYDFFDKNGKWHHLTKKELLDFYEKH